MNKKIIVLIIFAIVLVGIGAVCIKYFSKEKIVEIEESTTTIIIPGSYFNFIGSTPEGTAESYKEYCVSTRVDNGDVIIEVTDEQKEYLIKENEKFIEDTLVDFKAANGSYYYELSEDYSQVIYAYDEKIDNTLQAKILLGVTSMHVLNGILDTNNSDWKIELIVKNCHTDNIVAEVTLPEGRVHFDNTDWERSYNN